jgi:hypothetical protein
MGALLVMQPALEGLIDPNSRLWALRALLAFCFSFAAGFGLTWALQLAQRRTAGQSLFRIIAAVSVAAGILASGWSFVDTNVFESSWVPTNDDPNVEYTGFCTWGPEGCSSFEISKPRIGIELPPDTQDIGVGVFAGTMTYVVLVALVLSKRALERPL